VFGPGGPGGLGQPAGRFPNSVLVLRAFNLYQQWLWEAQTSHVCWETVEEAVIAWARMTDTRNLEQRDKELCRFREFARRLPWPLLMHLFPWPDLNLL
jgi:hypothetical protein